MANSDEGMRDFFRVLLAGFLPPLAVFLKSGVGGALFVNVILTLLGWVPGQLHALWHLASITEDGRVARDGTWRFFTYLALVLPPLAVIMKEGLGLSFVINLVLTLLGGLPGLLHAAYVVTQR